MEYEHQQLDVDMGQIKEESQFIEDLGADSLAIVELVLAFEEQFEIETQAGMVGDRYHGAKHRQLSVQSLEELAAAKPFVP